MHPKHIAEAKEYGEQAWEAIDKIDNTEKMLEEFDEVFYEIMNIETEFNTRKVGKNTHYHLKK